MGVMGTQNEYEKKVNREKKTFIEREKWAYGCTYGCTA